RHAVRQLALQALALRLRPLDGEALRSGRPEDPRRRPGLRAADADLGDPDLPVRGPARRSLRGLPRPDAGPGRLPAAVRPEFRPFRGAGDDVPDLFLLRLLPQNPPDVRPAFGRP